MERKEVAVLVISWRNLLSHLLMTQLFMAPGHFPLEAPAHRHDIGNLEVSSRFFSLLRYSKLTSAYAQR